MDFEDYTGSVPGQHYRPETTVDVQFIQRTVPAVIVPLVGYGILCAFTPYEVGVGLWAAIALVILPGVSGLILHSIGAAVSTNRRATRGFSVNAVLFVIYAIVNMAMIHDRITAPSAGLGALPAMLMAALGYGLVAGVVGGLIASLPVHHHTEEGY